MWVEGSRCRGADVDRALRGVSDQGPADPTALAALLLRTAGQRRLGLRHRCVLDALWRGAEGHGTSLEANERRAQEVSGRFVDAWRFAFARTGDADDALGLSACSQA